MFETHRILGESATDKIERLSIPEPNSGCWIWLASTGGIGNMLYGYAWNGIKNVRAHRFSYEAFKGEVPDALNVLHKCDNFLCVNPEHLFLGTHQDNMDDYARKRKAKTGIYAFPVARKRMSPEQLELDKKYKESLPKKDKFSDEKVHMIRALRLVRSLTYIEIAKLLNTNPSYVRKICLGIKWSSIPPIDYVDFLDRNSITSGSVASKQFLPA